jgi:hypothetical protein
MAFDIHGPLPRLSLGFTLLAKNDT